MLRGSLNDCSYKVRIAMVVVAIECRIEVLKGRFSIECVTRSGFSGAEFSLELVAFCGVPG